METISVSGDSGRTHLGIAPVNPPRAEVDRTQITLALPLTADQMDKLISNPVDTIDRPARRSAERETGSLF